MSEMKRSNAEFAGAKIVNGKFVEVVLRAWTKPKGLFARGPVINLAKEDKSGYPAIAFLSV